MTLRIQPIISNIDMIPKIIHYCWFGHGPLPPLAVKCIESWKKYLPEYEIKRWDESNFDIEMIAYTAEAYAARKYAFVSDYARFWILYHHGGLYFDTDVEVIKPLDDIVERGPFLGCEQAANPNQSPDSSGKGLWCAPGLGMGATAGLKALSEIMDVYAHSHFDKPRKGKPAITVVHYTTNYLCEHGLLNSPSIQEIEGIFIYPNDFFCPIHPVTKRMHITKNTRTIHHYAASWKELDTKYKVKKAIRSLMPESLLLCFNKMKKRRKR